MENDWCHFIPTYDENNKIMGAPCIAISDTPLCTVERPAAINTHNYLFVVTVVTDDNVSWAVHIKNHASDPVGLSLVMFWCPKTWLLQECGHVVIVVLLSRRIRDNKAPDDKIRHVPIASYCFWTSSSARLSRNFGHHLRQAGPPCLVGGNIQMQMVIVRKLIDTKRWPIHQREAC